MGILKNEFSWSHSRGETFRECLRRYYYQYYGYWGGWDTTADPFVRKLYVLRNLKNRYLWAGSIVHDVVAGLLSQARSRQTLAAPEAGAEAGGAARAEAVAEVAGEAAAEAAAEVAGEAAAEAAVERMRAEFRQSRDGLYLERPKKATGLVEHHYREEVTRDEWRSFADMVRRSIRGFAAGGWLDTARTLPVDAWLTLEDLLTFEIEGAKVYVKMDWAYRSTGGAVICDWKTGKRRPQPGGLQLGCYALYAKEAWGVPPERIQVIEANINTGQTGTAVLSDDHIEEAREKIASSIHEMRALLQDPETNTARREDFPAQPAGHTCRRCVFREICEDYAKMAGAAPETLATQR